MSSSLVRVMFSWLFIFVMVQPLLSHIDYLLNVNVKANAEYAAQKAAPSGRVTPEIQQEVFNNLAALGLNSTIEYQSTTVSREQRIDVRIRAPRAPMFLYRFGSESVPSEYYAHAYVMSEYIP